MDSGKKWALGGTFILIAAVGIRVGLIYRERHEAAAPTQTSSTWTVSDDDMVFLKKTRPSTLQDVKDLSGKPLWISAGGQIDYYPYTAHKVDYAHSSGILLGADRIDIKDAIEAIAPKAATFRIPGGDRHVLFVFTRPARKPSTPSPSATATRASTPSTSTRSSSTKTPTPSTKSGPPTPGKPSTNTAPSPGMNERQAQLSLGQVSSSQSTDYGNRSVVYDHQGHPVTVTFEKDKATAIREGGSL